LSVFDSGGTPESNRRLINYSYLKFRGHFQGLITPVNRPSRNKDKGSNTKMPLIVVPTEGVIFGGVSSETWGIIFTILMAVMMFDFCIFG
jgi:hypothetical protein